jgi:hypothetical protein
VQIALCQAANPGNTRPESRASMLRYSNAFLWRGRTYCASQFEGALTTPTSDARPSARLDSNWVRVVAFSSAAKEISAVGNAHIVNS